MARLFRKFLTGLIVAAALLLTADWIAYQFRLSHGTAFDSVKVQSYLATSLKGNKTEYDYLGEIEKPCVRVILPHASEPPCWWLRRHKEQWE